MDIIINIKTSEQNDEQKDEEYIMNENWKFVKENSWSNNESKIEINIDEE